MNGHRSSNNGIGRDELVRPDEEGLGRDLGVDRQVGHLELARRRFSPRRPIDSIAGRHQQGPSGAGQQVIEVEGEVRSRVARRSRQRDPRRTIGQLRIRPALEAGEHLLDPEGPGRQRDLGDVDGEDGEIMAPRRQPVGAPGPERELGGEIPVAERACPARLERLTKAIAHLLPLRRGQELEAIGLGRLEVGEDRELLIVN